MVTELDMVVAFNMGSPLKKSHHPLVKSSFRSDIFLYPSIVPLILHSANIRLPLLIRE